MAGDATGKAIKEAIRKLGPLEKEKKRANFDSDCFAKPFIKTACAG